MKLTTTALNILEKRYLLRDQNNSLIENPEGMFRRVAKAAAEADKLYDHSADVEKIQNEFFEMMSNLEFLPNSPTLMNAGKLLGQLSACFVIPVGDSMEEIFDALKYSALIHKSGGGTGFSFSRLRPRGALVKSTGGTSSGPVSFMRLFNLATEVVKQGGKRRGANMGILKVSHPDILEFVTCKKTPGELENFNISVGITEDFIRAVESGSDYDLFNPQSGSSAGKLNAKKVFDLISETAWNSGEPGIVFLDRINRDNPTPHLGEIESTNPCGEQPLLPFESCNLGSVNLALMVKTTNGKKDLDYDRLHRVIHTAVHFLDNIIDVNKYPMDIIKQITLRNRKIGLGVMGFADLLFQLGIPYNSNEALQTAEQIMWFVSKQSKEASLQLAQKRGAYPEFEKTKCLIFRNATTTTIAPTGTLSIIAGVSSGIEPVYSLSYIRRAADQEYMEVNSVFKDVLSKSGILSESLMKKVSKSGSIQEIIEIPEAARKVFVTAHDIEPEWHVRMQAAFQKHTDNAVSKTVNLPNNATVEDVKEVFMLAYKLNLKGITVYRDGSRESQVLNTGMSSKTGHASQNAPDSELCIDCRYDDTLQGICPTCD